MTDFAPVEPTDPKAGRAKSSEVELLGDIGLVSASREGDMAAYDQLVRRYQVRIYATIYHMTSNHEDANDLAQETFIKAYSALKTFKGDSSFYTWVYRIAVNKTINFLKTRKNKTQLSLNDLDFNAEHDPDLLALVSEDPAPRRGLEGASGKIERGSDQAVRNAQTGGDPA